MLLVIVSVASLFGLMLVWVCLAVFCLLVVFVWWYALCMFAGDCFLLRFIVLVVAFGLLVLFTCLCCLFLLGCGLSVCLRGLFTYLCGYTW